MVCSCVDKGKPWDSVLPFSPEGQRVSLAGTSGWRVTGIQFQLHITPELGHFLTPVSEPGGALMPEVLALIRHE